MQDWICTKETYEISHLVVFVFLDRLHAVGKCLLGRDLLPVLVTGRH